MIGRYLNACAEGNKNEGTRWDEVVIWYLSQREGSLESEEQFEYEERIVNKVMRLEL